MIYRALVQGVIALALGAAALPAAADVVEDFYKGKNVTIAIGFGPGGGYDTYTRLIARHIGKHIPGNPTMVVQQMPGAGSRLAANWLYNVAPKDGTALGVIGENSALDQALKADGIKFDVAKFQWIGNPISDTNITFVMAHTGLVTFDDVLKKGGLICGGTGASSPSILQPTILNNMLDAKIKIVSGYPGGGDVNLAMERNEVNCRGSNQWASTKATTRPWVEGKKINILVQFAVKPDPSISAYQGRPVPTIVDLAKNETDKKAVMALVSGAVFGRPIIAPPETPAPRVAALRKAFEATMKDKTFLDEAAKAKMDLNPVFGEELTKLAAESTAISDAVAKRVQELVQIKDVQEIPAAPAKKK
jgi:tripartite-type tricarboxylate transporter receptor subunit TctC